MKRLLRLALAADFVALVTVLLGSWTRINGAGMTCPDWPLCHGQVFPSLVDGSIYEWAHRLLALSVAPLVAAVVVVGWRRREQSPLIAPTLGVIVALFFVQVLLGAETVRLGNSPVSVVLHWGTAMALIAAFTALAVIAASSPVAAATSRDESRPAVNLRFTLVTTATLAFITMCIGAYVSSSGAGLACLSVPGCAGNVVVYSPEQYIQMLHRAAAAATLLFAAAAFALSWVASSSRRVRISTACGVGLVCLQIILGLFNVTLRLPDALREAHAINAALLFLTFFVAAVFAIMDSWLAQPDRLIAGGARR